MKIDIELVEKVKSGDKAAFSQLYESIYADTYRLAYSFTKSKEDAQDAVQNAFVILYKKIETLKNTNSFKSWFNTIVVNEALRINKKKKSYALNFTDVNDENSDSEFENSIIDENDNFTPENYADKKEIIKTVGKIMDELSEEQKQCLQLFYYEDMKIKEISKALNVPEGTVKTRLKRGKSKFEEIAKEYEKKGYKFFGFSVLPIFFSSSLSNIQIPDMPYEKLVAPALITSGALAGKVTASAITIKKTVAGILAAISVAVGIGVAAHYINYNSAVSMVENENCMIYSDFYIDESKDLYDGTIYCLNKDGETGNPTDIKWQIDDVCAFKYILYDNELFYLDVLDFNIYEINIEDKNPKPIKISKNALTDGTGHPPDTWLTKLSFNMYQKGGKIIYVTKDDFGKMGGPSWGYAYDIEKKETQLAVALNSYGGLDVNQDGFVVWNEDSENTYSLYDENGKKIKSNYEENENAVISEGDNSVLEAVSLYDYSGNQDVDIKYINKITGKTETYNQGKYSALACDGRGGIYYIEPVFDEETDDIRGLKSCYQHSVTENNHFVANDCNYTYYSDTKNKCIKRVNNRTKKESKYIDNVKSYQVILENDYLYYSDDKKMAIYCVNTDENDTAPIKISRNKIAAAELGGTDNNLINFNLYKGNILYVANKDGWYSGSEESYVYKYNVSTKKTEIIYTSNSIERVGIGSNYAFYTSIYDEDLEDFMYKYYDESGNELQNMANPQGDITVFEDRKYLIYRRIVEDDCTYYIFNKETNEKKKCDGMYYQLNAVINDKIYAIKCSYTGYDPMVYEETVLLDWSDLDDA